MAAQVTVKDHGYNALVERLYGAAKTQPVVKVGILAKDGDEVHVERVAARAGERTAKGNATKAGKRAAKEAAAYVRVKDRAANDGTDHDPVTVLQVAIFNEFGTDRIPERSFLRAFFDEEDARIRSTLTTLMRSVVRGERTKEQVLELLGQWCVGQIQQRIASGIAPANAESTIKQKGSSKPLIDHGILRASISYEVDGG